MLCAARTTEQTERNRAVKIHSLKPENIQHALKPESIQDNVDGLKSILDGLAAIESNYALEASFGRKACMAVLEMGQVNAQAMAALKRLDELVDSVHDYLNQMARAKRESIHLFPGIVERVNSTQVWATNVLDEEKDRNRVRRLRRELRDRYGGSKKFGRRGEGPSPSLP